MIASAGAGPVSSILFHGSLWRDGRWFSITSSGALIVNNKPAAIEMALDGVGISFCIDDTVRDHIEAGRLIPLLQTWSAPFSGFHLCYPRQRHMLAAMLTVIDRIRAAAV